MLENLYELILITGRFLDSLKGAKKLANFENLNIPQLGQHITSQSQSAKLQHIIQHARWAALQVARTTTCHVHGCSPHCLRSSWSWETKSLKDSSYLEQYLKYREFFGTPLVSFVPCFPCSLLVFTSMNRGRPQQPLMVPPLLLQALCPGNLRWRRRA